MRKMTLLEMVQNIASALETDEVNSITDTTESLQIAEVIKETFYEQFNNITIPEHQKLFKLESVSDLTRPNYLRLPSNINKVEWIKYMDFQSGGWTRPLKYMNPEEFFERQFLFLDNDDALTLVIDPSGIEYFVQNNTTPQWFTILEDEFVVTNGYDSFVEDTLQGVNSVAFGTVGFEFKMEDDFVPPIDATLFPLLLAESKSVCFVNLKQIASSKEEQRARRQRIRMQNDQFRSRQAQFEYRNRGPNYARHR